jgi:predicted choloylglycine hydrolase
MQGIAEGAGVSFYDIAALNFTYDLGERTACSMALLPMTADGPILLNTLDDFPTGKHRQNYPCFVQVAYPTDGHAMVFLCNYGTVWAHQGLNDAGLAMGSTSGGLGAPRGGANYDGMYYALLARYALQFHESADEVIKIFTANRQISKGINVAVLDRAGKGAVFEYSASAVGVRPTKTNEPLYATNFFQTDKYPPYDKSVEEYDYMKNARARYRRFGELFATMKEPSLTSAQRVLLDDNGGQQGQICQDNNVMITATANLFVCRDATAQVYLGNPRQSKPVTVRLDPSKKPAAGKLPPPSEEVEAVNRATPKKFKQEHHQFKGIKVTAVEHANVACTVKLPQGERRVDLSAATIMLFTSGTLTDVPSDKFTVLYGKLAEDRLSFDASEIITYRGYGSGFGRLLATEASGRFHQAEGKIEIEYEQGKRVQVKTAKDCRIVVAYKVPPGEVSAAKPADLYGYTLEPDGDIVATWFNIHLTAEEAAAFRSRARADK